MYEPQRSVFTEADFESLGWHDNCVHSWAWEPWYPEAAEDNMLVLDLDYIVEWMEPVSPATEFSFLVAPCTLVFEGAGELCVDARGLSGMHLSINDISWAPATVPSGAEGFRRWTIDGHNFLMVFEGRGFTQYLRAKPVASTRQWLTLTQRGGLSFETRGYLEPTN